MSDNIDAIIRELEAQHQQSKEVRRKQIDLGRSRGRLLSTIRSADGLEYVDGESHGDFVHRWAPLWIRTGRMLRLLHGPEVFKHLNFSGDPVYAVCIELLERAFWTVDRAHFEGDLLNVVEGLLRAERAMSLRWFFHRLEKELLEYWSRVAGEQPAPEPASPATTVVTPVPPGVGKKKLYPSQEAAYQMAQWAFRIDPELREVSETQLYAWLKSRSDLPGRLASEASFLRYLGAARSFRGGPKRERRKWSSSRSATNRAGEQAEEAEDSDSSG